MRYHQVSSADGDFVDPWVPSSVNRRRMKGFQTHVFQNGSFDNFASAFLVVARFLEYLFQVYSVAYNCLNDIDSRFKFEIRETSNANTKKAMFAVCIKNREQEAPI